MSFQVPTATSQHMDDLFDILVESGGGWCFKVQTSEKVTLSRKLSVRLKLIGLI